MMKLDRQNWIDIPLKFLFSERTAGAWGTEPENGDGVICIRAADFITHELRHKVADLTRRKYDNKELQSRQLQKGDLIIERSGGGEKQPVGRVISFDLDEVALCSNFLEILRPHQSYLYSRFGSYLFYSFWASRALTPYIKQTTGIQNLDAEGYLSQIIHLPTLIYQKQISNYLDRETEKIDALIAAKKRLLKLLVEKRRSMITHAVTRGLKDDVLMKDSGVEWLGEIPKDWRLVKIKHVATIGNGSTPLRDELPYWQNGLFPWLTSTVANDDIIGDAEEFVTAVALKECHLPIVRPNSILVAITGQGKTRGKAALLPYQATINQHLAFITPLDKFLEAEFLRLFLASAYNVLRMISEGMGSTKGALTCEQLGDFIIPLPSIVEQQKIVNDLQNTTQHIDLLSGVTTEAIALLQERRTSLISAAVTGQICIPD
jgi:type I restriction enzyme, S subunit